MAQARKISQTFNGPNRWIIGGSYLKLLSTVNSVDVKLYLAGQIVVDASQVDQGFYSREAFDRIEITTGANELVEFIVADKEAGSDQFTGSVNSTIVSPLDDEGAGATTLRVTRFADHVSRAGAAFGANGLQVAVAAQLSHVQLFNPVGSAIFVYVDLSDIANQGNTVPMYYTLYNVALATLIRNGQNLNGGGANSVAEIRSTTNAAVLGTVIRAVTQSINFDKTCEFPAAVRLPAGWGLNIVANAVNQSCMGSFLWREYAT